MFWFYVAMAIFGLSLTVPMVLGGIGDLDAGIDGGTDALDGGLDVDADPGADLVADVDTGFGADLDGVDADLDGVDLDGVGGLVGDTVAGLLSFRSVVFGSAFFGVSGVVFTLFGYGFGLTLFSALLVGGAAAIANSVLFSALRRSSVDSNVTEQTLVGRSGAVVLPIDPGRRGRVRIALGDQPHYLVARHADDRDGETIARGSPIVIVAVEDGTALVSALVGLDTS